MYRNLKLESMIKIIEVRDILTQLCLIKNK